MNIAIVIGVSHYTDKNIGDLPGCVVDGALMEGILKSSGRFEPILSLTTNTDSKTVKRELARFIEEHKDKGVEEVFFYYTGHGELQGDDVHFLLSDFDEKRSKQTSLSNEEVDTLLRSLNTKLAVKVVDACHAGVAYIKDHSVLEKAITATQGRFEHCYFMFSCHTDQLSFQAQDSLSAFTESFANAVKSFAGSPIRYKDITDCISDDFARSGEQTPLFVSQASLTEVFVDVRIAISDLVDAVLTKPVQFAGDLATTTTTLPPQSLVEVVKKDAQRYCTKEEAVQLCNVAMTRALDRPFGAEIAELFDVLTERVTDIDALPERAAIGRWLQENTHDYFAEPRCRTERYVAREPIMHSILPSVQELLNPKFKEVEKTREVIDSYSLTIKVPLIGVSVTLRPKFQNLYCWKLHLAYVFSKLSLRVFYGYVRLGEFGGDKPAPPLRIAWKTVELPLKDQTGINDWTNETLAEFEQAVVADLNSRFLPQVTTTQNEKDG